MGEPIVLSSLSLLSVAAGIFFLVQERQQREEAVRHLEEWALEPDVLRRRRRPRLLMWAERFDFSAMGTRIAKRLQQADLDVRPSTYVSALGVAGLLTYLVSRVGLGGAGSQGTGLTSLVLFGGLSTLVVWAGSRTFLDFRRDHYRSALAAQMPEVALLMANGLRAGLSVRQALELVAERLPRPAGSEFERIAREVQLGSPWDRALNRLLERVPIEELQILVTALQIQVRAGGNLSRALTVMANGIRAQHRLREEINVSTAEIRFTSLVAIVLPLLTLFVLNRAMDNVVYRFISNAWWGYLPFGYLAFALFVGGLGGAFVLIQRLSRVEL